jgi:hypothetical protein
MPRVFLALLLLSACTTVPDQSAVRPEKSTPSISREECLIDPVVSEWTVLDDRQLLLRVDNHQAYLAKIDAPALPMRTGRRIRFMDDDHNGRICGSGQDALTFGSNGTTDRIPILSLQRLAAEEAEQLIKTAGKRASAE